MDKIATYNLTGVTSDAFGQVPTLLSLMLLVYTKTCQQQVTPLVPTV